MNEDPKELTVGTVRQQTALCNADRRVILIPGPKLAMVLGTRRIILKSCYPDTIDENREWNSTFKIEGEIS